MPLATVPTHSRALGVATLAVWVLTAGVGAYMLRTLITADGLRRQRRVAGGLPPGVLYGHFSLALTGLAVWASYVATGWSALAWTAVGLLMPAIGLGISTVTLWTPFPGPASGHTSPPGSMLGPVAEDALRPRITDEVLASAVTDAAVASRLVEEVIASVHADPVRPGRVRRSHLAALIPAGHGVGALITFLLAILTAAGAT